MSAHYDSYDYPSYWIGREYEHQSELIALKELLKKIPALSTILEIGAGFGRLTPTYIYRAKKVILSDPSSTLLKVARRRFQQKNVRVLQAKIENLPKRLKPKSVDVVVMVRVLHHLSDVDEAFSTISKLLKSRGYLILEFANKKHAKATLLELAKGNFLFPLDIFPKDIRSAKSIKKKTLPFINYHPDFVVTALTENGFEILEKRSVSNIRSNLAKRIFPLSSLLWISRSLQVPLGYINFGPSIFILARKKI